MDEATFTALTGVTLSETDSERFETILAVATKELERLLGYPLDPSDWENLYNETGKTRTDCLCPDVDTDNLDPADEVVGSYRLYKWYPTDRFIGIDPATAINAVKLVNNDITFKTFNDGTNENEYNVIWENGVTKVSYFLDLARCQNWCGFRTPCWRDMDWVMVAVDADWAYEDMPTELNAILANLIAEGFRGYGDDEIQSESRGSHSYTKRDLRTVSERYPILAEFAGPNGLAKRKRIV